MEKERLFSIQKMNKFYLFPFLVPIFCFCTKFFSEPMKYPTEEKNIKDVSEDNEHRFVFLYQMINSTSLIWGGLLYVVSYFRSKKENEDEDRKNLRRTFQKVLDEGKGVEDYKKNKLKSISIMIFMSLIITVYNIIKGYGTGHPQLEKRLYFLFFFTLINLFLFKRQIYSHQKLSLLIGLIGMVCIFATFFLTDAHKNTYLWQFDVILFFGSIFYSLYLVLYKYLTNNMAMNPFLLILIIGIISTFFTIVGYIIYSLAKGKGFLYVNLFIPQGSYVYTNRLWLKIMMYTIINTILQVLIFLVVYFFSPEVFAISDIISHFMSFLQKCFEKKIKNPAQITVNVIAYIVIILASFIYNEILVCNFWGLNENTWKAIDLKANIDLNYIDDRCSESIGDDIEMVRSSSLNGASMFSPYTLLEDANNSFLTS